MPPVIAERPTVTGLYKSAVVLASLGAESAASILGLMTDQEVEKLVREMTRLGPIKNEERDLVLEEFSFRIDQSSGGVLGGMDFAREMLEQAMGSDRASRMLTDLASEAPPAPTLSEILEGTTPEILAGLIVDEHPQLVALLVEQLPVDRAAALLAALPAELQGPVASRLAQMEPPAPIAVQHLERCLLEKLKSADGGGGGERAAGPRRVADILGKMRRSVEGFVMSALEKESPQVAEQVNRYRFNFDNLLQLDGRSMQRILRDVEADTLKLAMKGLDEERQEALFSNMSERAAARLREDLETTGPTRLRDVEVAQQTMVAIARTLQENGEVQFSIGAGDDGGDGGDEVFV